MRHRLSRGSPGDRQALDAVDELRQQQRRFFGGDDVWYLVAQFIEEHPDLATGQICAEAEMRTATTESPMRIRGARHVELPGVAERRLVTVGRVVEQRDLVAGRHL